MNLKALYLSHHEANKEDPVYMEGFNAGPGAECPYEFDEANGILLARLSVKETLSEEELTELTRLRELLDKTPWTRWMDGQDVAEEIKE